LPSYLQYLSQESRIMVSSICLLGP
jgi:hypothetical protein